MVGTPRPRTFRSCSGRCWRPWPRSGASGSTAPSAPAATRRALLDAGAERVIAVDRDPSVVRAGRGLGGWLWRPAGPPRGAVLRARRAGGRAARRGRARPRRVVDADRPGRARLFLPEGRPARHADGRAAGRSAADLVNELPEAELADLLFLYGEERASRRIARAIVAARPLVDHAPSWPRSCAARLPRPKPGQSDPATRTLPGAADRGERRVRRTAIAA